MEYKTLSALIQKGMSVDSGSGTVAKNVYEENLPDNITAEQAEQVNTYNGTFTAALMHATGTKGHELDMDTLEVSSDCGSVSFEGHYEREVEINGETRHGYVVGTMMSYVDGMDGAIAQVQDDIASLVSSSVESVEEEEALEA